MVSFSVWRTLCTKVELSFKKISNIIGNDIIYYYIALCSCSVIKVTSVEQYKKIIATYPVIVFGYFVDHNTEKAKAFFTAASQVDNPVFAIFLAEERKVLWELEGYIDDQDVVLWKNGNRICYKGASQADDIISWSKKKTGPPAIEVTSVEHAKEVIATHPVVVFGFFTDRDTDMAKTFLTVAALAHEDVFAIVSDHKIIAELEAEDQAVMMFKKFDENRVKYDGEKFTEDSFKTWVVLQRTPVLVEYSEQLARQERYGVRYEHYLELFLSKKNGDFEKFIDALKPIVNKYRDKIPLSVVYNVDEDENRRALDSMAVKKEDVPCIRLNVNKEHCKIKKYKPTSDKLTAQSVEEFIQLFIAGELKPYLRRQELPADWDKNPVKVLVASNFDEVVFDTNKNVLVNFCAPWCPPCKDLVPIYNKLGEHFETDEDVVIAKIDAYNNEPEDIKIRAYPTIRLYRKNNQVREYDIDRDRTLEDLIKFVESDGVEGAAPTSSA